MRKIFGIMSIVVLSSSFSSFGVLSISDVTDEGQAAWRIATDVGIFYLQKEAGGFSSLTDPQGNDWISFNRGAGSGGMYRGIPNLVHSADASQSDYYHPGYTKVNSTIASQTDSKITINCDAKDKAWKVRYDFYPGYVQVTMLQKVNNYWFLYEGTPGGSLQPSTDWWLMQGPVKKTCANNQELDLPATTLTSKTCEWIAFGDANQKRALILIHDNDGLIDRFYQMENNMTVFGFGRNSNYLDKLLSTVPQSFYIALIEDSSYATVTGKVASIFSPTGIINQQKERTISAVESFMQTSSGTLSLYALNGVLIEKLDRGSLKVKSLSEYISLNRASLPQGAYLAKITVNGKSVTERIVLK